MTRIELHQARFRAHAELGFYQAWRSDDDPHHPKLAARYCPCGTRLRRTKSHFDRLCDACDDKARADKPIYDLHPADSECVDCRRPIYHQSRRCRTCEAARRGQR